MAGKGKNVGSNAKRRSHSSKAGLQFLVARIARFLKVGKYAKCVSAGAPIFLVVVLEYLAAEVLEWAGIAAWNDKMTRIIPRHIQLAIRFDKEVNQFLRDMTIPNGGVIQRIQNIFLPNNKSNTSKVVVAISQEEED